MVLALFLKKFQEDALKRQGCRKTGRWFHPQQPVAKVHGRSNDDTSCLTALLVAQMCLIFSPLAPRRVGASSFSVLRRTFATVRYVRCGKFVTKGSNSHFGRMGAVGRRNGGSEPLALFTTI